MPTASPVTSGSARPPCPTRSSSWRRRPAGAVDRGETDLLRIGTAVGKYLVCKRGPGALAEALECLGGNGFVEESIMPRLYREAPVNSVWEGSGNVNALDVLRVLRTSP